MLEYYSILLNNNQSINNTVPSIPHCLLTNHNTHQIQFLQWDIFDKLPTAFPLCHHSLLVCNVLWWQLDERNKMWNAISFIILLSNDLLISYHVHTICVWLCVVVSDACCVVFLFCFSSSCVTCAASFSGVSIVHRPFGIR